MYDQSYCYLDVPNSPNYNSNEDEQYKYIAERTSEELELIERMRAEGETW